jgi:hypothetical protein
VVDDVAALGALLAGPDLANQPRRSGRGNRRLPVELSKAWLLENKRLALRYDRPDFMIQSLFQVASVFLVASRLAREF